jgi:hypothetical protein
MIFLLRKTHQHIISGIIKHYFLVSVKVTKNPPKLIMV